MILAGAALAVAVQQARLVGLAVERAEGGAALVLVADADPGPGSARREGREVLISFPVAAPEDVLAPQALPPIEALRLEPTGEGLALRVLVPPEARFVVHREGARLRILFTGGQEAGPAGADAASELDRLYRGLFPAAAAGEGMGSVTSEAPAAAFDGLRVGAADLRPSLRVGYFDGDVALLEPPQAVSDRYVQVEPRLEAGLPIRAALLTAEYSPRLRRGSAFASVNSTSHFAGATLDVPGATLDLRLAGRLARGILETHEVDPGGEYFFGLGRFARRTLSGEARLSRGGRLGLEGGFERTRVEVRPPSTFFDYTSWSLRGGLGYEATPNLRLRLLYGHRRVPASPERPLSESRAHLVGLDLLGDVLPRLSGRVSLAYEDQKSPRAAAGGTRFRGLAFDLSLVREVSPSTSLSLVATRAARISAFESNAFYVSTAGALRLAGPLALGFEGSAAAGYHWNHYRTAASGSGVRREDRIFGWTVGVGRPLTRRAHLRADYRRERRNSNLDAFDLTTEALLVQVGIGFLGGAGR